MGNFKLMDKMIIHLICPDQMGIISRLTSILHESMNNILSIQQYVDKEKAKFYIRLSVQLNSEKIFPKTELLNLNNELKGKMNLFNPNKKINVAILGTKESAPIYDLLIKNKSHELSCNFPIIVSNHRELSGISGQFDIDFYEISNNDELISILKDNRIDLIVLARYMQIIPEDIVELYKNKIINIHHGFLPAFKGARPYHQAYDRGVKIVGATAHYVTDKLDEGPIIFQDTIQINHKHSIRDIIQLGRDIEKNVLSKAVRAHLDYKIIVHNQKTIIFD